MKKFHLGLTKNTTVTFSLSLTPASGSLSTSSPGPGINCFPPAFALSVCALVLLTVRDLVKPPGEAEGSERGGIVRLEEDEMTELGVS